MTNIGIVSWGTYFPAHIETAAEVAAATGIPEEIVVKKMGLVQKHIAGPDDHCATMGAKAAQQALERAGVSPHEVNLIIYHGSEYKEHFVWSAATRIQELIGAENAGAFELYALCAGAPIAFKTARAMMLEDNSLKYVLLVTASRENDLVHYDNERARFMFNFGAGAGAVLLKREYSENIVLGSSVISDGVLSHSVVMKAGGSCMPPSEQTVQQDLHQLDVPDLKFMGERLGEVSHSNFLQVIRQAVEKSGYQVEDIDFLGLVHMKRSAYDAILADLGLRQEQSIYLDHYGHVQSVDQIIALDLAHQRGILKDGDLVVLAGAGTGYTWSAVAIRWGKETL
ncbi:MAG: beta-ketoacyl-ACP synthase [Phototrophicales bacterium]|nr:MAG: beta-ketoacyl-ACP synthase [Phototrophicales bacterium]